MDKAYEPQEVETRRYTEWESKGYFHAEAPAPLEGSSDHHTDGQARSLVQGDQRTPGHPKYSITIPPPNVTGQLHMGHALTYTVQDCLGRWRRMLGDTVLILPGTDHAGIATQNVVEKEIAKEGLSRHDLGREGFVERVWAWKEEYGSRIVRQLRRLGCSFDWQRERFTFDGAYEDAVLEAFVRFYDQGLIYRGNRMVNWCPRCRTVISDIEVAEEDQDGYLWHIHYPFEDGSGYVTVATTRPETMLGDTAVAVNPADERYRDKIGKTLILPLVGRRIPLIADDYASLEMGTGAVKVTPAHDPNDYEAGQRHNLAQITVIGFDAMMTPEAGERYSGMDRYDARALVVSDLEAEGLLEKVEDYKHRVPTCERCHTVIEPLLSDQWFMTMQGTDIWRNAITVVEKDEITFVPDRYKKVYLDWMEGLRDWPLSRQLWWGHRIPIFYGPDDKRVGAKSVEDAIRRFQEQHGMTVTAEQIEQDPDVLDTWFSSALWPFATMGWPGTSPDLEYFYPTNVLTTSREIIYLWVARMIMTGIEFMGKRPFDEVYIFATVLDAKGRRMSKSLGNGIDPVEMIEKYGADALRFSLLRLASKGQDIRFAESRIPESRNFANKLWNAARFVRMNLPDGWEPAASEPARLTLPQRWILSRLQTVAGQVNAALAGYDLDDACNVLYEFLWNEYCDWFVELSKPALSGDTVDEMERQIARTVLWEVLESTLRLLHPVMPYVTEEIWQALPHRGATIMLAPYPKPDPALADPEAEAAMAVVIDSVSALRALRAEFTPGGPENEAARAAMIGRRLTVTFVPESSAAEAALADQMNAIVTLARLGEVQIVPATPAAKSVSTDVAGATLYVPASELLEGVDPEKETKRLAGEIGKLEKELVGVRAKLDNPAFVERAAPDAVEKARGDASDLGRRIERMRERQALLA